LSYSKIRHIKQGQEPPLQIEQSACKESGIEETSEGLDMQTKVTYLTLLIHVLCFRLLFEGENYSFIFSLQDK
jgi:hypothetical protein